LALLTGTRENGTKQSITLILLQNRLPRKKKRFVQDLILPGAGQLYAGNPVEALNALLVNGLCFFLFGYNIVEKNFPEALLTFLYLINRFYEGNICHAEREVA